MAAISYSMIKHLLTISFLLSWATSGAVRADALSDLRGFSVFDKVEIADLAKSDVKILHGPPMAGRFLSVQSCLVMAGPPAQQIEAMSKWNPTKHRELRVLLHSDLPASAPSSAFAKLKDAPDNGAVRAFVSATEKLSDDLQISKAEAKKGAPKSSGSGMSAEIVAFWSELLAARGKSLLSGGTGAQPPYDHASGGIRPNEELNTLLKEQDKIKKQFSGFISETGIGRGAGSLTPELYWEFLDVDGTGVVTLGASYSKSIGEGAYQAADVLYYASGGYYVALTLYQMWPVTVEGKASTLIWRGDMISSAALESLHGVERLGSESAMMKDISKAITLFRKDAGR